MEHTRGGGGGGGTYVNAVKALVIAAAPLPPPGPSAVEGIMCRYACRDTCSEDNDIS